MHRFLVLGATLAVALALSGSAAAWSWPADGQVLRPFELGSDTYAAGQHRGIDVAGAPGSPVRAPAAGAVTFAGSVPTHGRGVTILTADGYSVTLFHLETVQVVKGDAVDEGAPVGTMGSSGDAEHSEPSVHLGVRIADRPDGYVDPVGLLPARPAPTPPPAPAPAPAAVPTPAPAAVPTPASTPTASPPPVAQPPAPTATAPVLPAAPPAVPAPTTRPVAQEVTAAPPTVAPPAAPPEPIRAAVPVTTPSGANTAREAAAGVGGATRTEAIDGLLVGTPRSVGGALPEPAAATREPVGGQAPIDDARNARPVAEVRPHAVAERAGPPDHGAPPRAGAADSAAAMYGDRAMVAERAERRDGTAGFGLVALDERGLTRVPLDRARPVERTPVEAAVAAVAQGGRPALGELANGPGRLPASVAVRGPGTGLGLAELIAALALAGLVAARVVTRAARRIERDGAVLPDDTHLLRQLDTAHRSRLHDRRGRRVRASSAAARS